MLHLSFLGESRKMDIDSNALKLLIVRKPVSGIPKGFIHVPQLSPSLSLFDHTQMYWKKGVFNEEERTYLNSLGLQINEEKSWWHLYERAFRKELLERADMISGIKKIERLIKEGKEIYLFCYCKDVLHCHRGIIGNYLKSKGYKVDFRYLEKREESKVRLEQLSLFDI